MDTPANDMGERLTALAGRRPWWPLVEPTPRWVRVRVNDELVADTRRALLYVQYGAGALPRSFLPTYYVPLDDVVEGALIDPVEESPGLTVWAIQAARRRIEDAAWTHRQPPEPFAALAGRVTFAWRDPIVWFEEDERLLAHARDPHKRVDVLPSSRHVRVEVDGEVLAESRRPVLLFETTLPVRYYLPSEDVNVELVPSETRSVCPYKGEAMWWSTTVRGRAIDDIAWSYPSPIPENPRIARLVCFRNERIDLIVDGELQQRPVTPWS